MDLGWGIAGTGMISRIMGSKIMGESGMRVAAVGSRDLDRARGLAPALKASSAYGSYAELVRDPAVDVVYVATGPMEHLEVVRLAAEAGKGAVVEKPMAISSMDVEEMIRVTREAGTFLMEAMWMRFDPLIHQLVEMVGAGELGNVRSLSASFGRVIPRTPTERLWHVERGGGALFDLGVYPVSFSRLFLGDPVHLSAMGTFADTGIESEISVLAQYDQGACALLEASLTGFLPGCASITGTELRAELPAPFFVSPALLVKGNMGEVSRVFERGFLPDGFAGQLRETARCMVAGETESPVMPLAESLATTALMERILAEVPRV